MFDIGWPEFLVVLVVAILVIGPKDLPMALRTVGHWMRAIRKMGREFQDVVDDAMREADLEDLRKQARDLRNFRVDRMIENTVDPDGDLRRSVDFSDVAGKTDTAANPGRPAGPSLEKTSDATSASPGEAEGAPGSQAEDARKSA